MQKDTESDVDTKKNTGKKRHKTYLFEELLGSKVVRKAKWDVQNILKTYLEHEKWRDTPFLG